MKLVTGGSGVLGRALVEKLLEAGEPVRVYDLEPPGVHGDRVEFVAGDIRNRDQVISACAGCDTVFHLAAIMPQVRVKPAVFREVNVGGTLNVIRGCRTHGVERIVYASTIEIYGPQKDLPLLEDAPKRFTGPYSRNKWECEGHLRRAIKEHGIDAVMLRMPMILGPGFYHEKTTITLLERVRAGKVVPLPAPPEIPYTAVSSRDAATAFLLASRSREAVGESFNISADFLPVRRFLESFIAAVGSGSHIVAIPPVLVRPWLRFFEKMNLPPPLINTPPELLPFAMVGGAYDTTKAEKVLGYAPTMTCVEAMAALYEWYFHERESIEP